MAEEIIDEFGYTLDRITLEVGPKAGMFDVEVDGRLVFSKFDAHRHAEPGEVVELMKRAQQPVNGGPHDRVYPAGA